MAPIDQAANYIRNIPGAVSGAGGHNQTYHVAAALIEGFGLSISEARQLLSEYAARCTPPWSEREIEHKLESVKVDSSKLGKMVRHGVRWRHRSDCTPRQQIATPAPRQQAKAARYEVSDSLELPEPIDDGARKFIRAAFAEGEGIRIAQARPGDDGRELPKDAGVTLSREEWLRKLDKANGNPNGFMKSSERNGIFVSVNPMKLGGSKDADVTCYRHALLEFDNISKIEQWGIIQQSRVPCTSVISSGGKSIHAWVRVDASTRQEFDERVKALYQHFADYKPDEKNKNPSRFSRLPFCERGNSRQELLALGIGCESFSEWMAEKSIELAALPEHPGEVDELPGIDNADELTVDDSILPPLEIISGVLHQGSKGIIGASSKARKTWILLDLALSVATGKKFWNWETRQGRVIYLNLEIARPFIKWRLQQVARAKEITDMSLLDVWTLRGYAAPLWRLLPDLLAQIKERDYVLIVLDPVYKILGGRDENAAGDIGELCNELEQLAVKSGAALVFAAHYSKGNQSNKNAMDRIGGSGVFARDADSIITLTAHRVENCFTVDLILRNHPEQKPFVVGWEFPLMHVADLKPADLQQVAPSTVKAAKVPMDMLALVPALPNRILKATLLSKAQGTGFTQRGAREALESLIGDEAVLVTKEKRAGTNPAQYIIRNSTTK